MDEVRYPIGPFELVKDVSPEQRKAWIQDLADAPVKLHSAVVGLSAEQLDTPYRTGGWTVRQIVHHLAENDMLAYARFKFGLTEEAPQIRPASENLWAELPDRDVSVDDSLDLYRLVHKRWVTLLEGLTAADFDRTYVHPVSGVWKLDQAIGLYSWHDRHHTAQITSFRKRMGW
ncbi:YfiT family bacillithiol transferase [Alicyclobacillus kakegawensis]|uniref:YfiT family bacillithiol transferase n=1 Tax=Alicyclobacillus kakegawensis TaxID=392012 RepID=UPI000830968A|nr:putative metal-dependent hydrolase [Alicyclobacillus kakegawensis]